MRKSGFRVMHFFGLDTSLQLVHLTFPVLVVEEIVNRL
jgi:hypothetical protein